MLYKVNVSAIKFSGWAIVTSSNHQIHIYKEKGEYDCSIQLNCGCCHLLFELGSQLLDLIIL